MVAAEESRLVSQSQCVSTVSKEWEDQIGNEWQQIYILECSAMGREDLGSIINTKGVED